MRTSRAVAGLLAGSLLGSGGCFEEGDEVDSVVAATGSTAGDSATSAMMMMMMTMTMMTMTMTTSRARVMTATTATTMT